MKKAPPTGSDAQLLLEYEAPAQGNRTQLSSQRSQVIDFCSEIAKAREQERRDLVEKISASVSYLFRS